MPKRQKPVDLSPISGLDIKTIVVQETDGHDLIFAAERCAPPNGTKIDDNVFGILLRNQMIAGAIIKVDGKPVPGGSCQSYLTWGEKTRKLVGRIYDSICGTTEAEDELFKKLLAGTSGEEQPSTPSSSAPVSSESGSASQPSSDPAPR